MTGACTHISVAGSAVTLVSIIVGTSLGYYVFKFHPGITLGAVAGARSITAALGALTENAKSNVLVVGYSTGSGAPRLFIALLTIVVINPF